MENQIEDNGSEFFVYVPIEEAISEGLNLKTKSDRPDGKVKAFFDTRKDAEDFIKSRVRPNYEIKSNRPESLKR